MKIDLSDRMKTIVSMVIEGEPAADIGTDHGHVAAYLAAEGICPKVILTDIAELPLERAKSYFEEKGLTGDFRLGSGLEVLEPGEVSTVIIAGMGGETMIDMLSRDLDKAHSFKRIILQPRTFIGKLRVWLSQNGFEFRDYALCRERKQITEIMAVDAGEQVLENYLVSSFLVLKGDPLLKEYLEMKLHSAMHILEEFNKSKDQNKLIKMKLEWDVLYLENLLKKVN